MVPREKNFYVVLKGRKPGIYDDWFDCHAQVNGFSSSAFCSYKTLEEAEAAWASTGKHTIEFVDETPNNYMVQISMQSLLHQVCDTLQIQGPTYAREDVVDHNGQRFYRYRASLLTNLIGRPPVSLGRFATKKERAREDVVVELLRRVLACSGRKIGDFNFHNIALYENQIANLEAENFDLILKNSRLKQKLRTFMRNIN